MNPIPTRRQLTLGALALAVTLAAGACLGVDTRGRATAEISGPDGTPVRVITSTRFTRTQASPGLGPDTAGVNVRLLAADTSSETLPTSISRQLTDTQRIYVQVALTDSAAASGDGPLQTEVQLIIDGEQRARAAGDLRDTPLAVSFLSYVAQ